MTAVLHPPITEHVDTPPLSASQVEAAKVAKEVSEKDAAVAAAHLEFQNDVQAANDKRNAVLANYPDTSLAGIAAAAWNATKDVSDPEFGGCILSHRQKLLTHAEAVQRLGVTGENPSDFEIEVGRLFGELRLKAKAAGAVVSPVPLAGRPLTAAEIEAARVAAARENAAASPAKK